MRKSLLVSCFAIGLLCRVTHLMPHETQASPAATAVSGQRPITYPMITKLVSRQYTIEISAGPVEPLYTVIGAAGNPLVDHLTLAAMKQADPKLFNQVSPALSMRNMDASICGAETAIGD